jgi:hypothetical protein
VSDEESSLRESDSPVESSSGQEEENIALHGQNDEENDYEYLSPIKRKKT